MKKVSGPDTMKVSDWFTAPGGELVVRRADVWALLGWYHSTQVEPHLTIRGAVRRLWWRLSGQEKKLQSPWLQIRLQKDLREHLHALNRAKPADDSAQPTTFSGIAASNGQR